MVQVLNIRFYSDADVVGRSGGYRLSQCFATFFSRGMPIISGGLGCMDC